jgi:gluconolactonase
MKKFLPILGMAMIAISSSVRDWAAQPGHYKTQPSKIIRLDPAFDRIVPKEAVLEKVADGFAWVEGPVWNRAEGYLLFSGIPNNAVMKWKAKEGVSLFLKPSSQVPGHRVQVFVPGHR